MKNSADQGGCYPQRPKAEICRSPRSTEFFISYESRIQWLLYYSFKIFPPSRSFAITLFVFPLTKYNTTLSPGFLGQRFNNLQRAALLTHFDVIGSIIFGGLHLWRHWFNMLKILSNFGEQQLVMVNYACGFNQSETGKYFEWIIIKYIVCVLAVYCLHLLTIFSDQAQPETITSFSSLISQNIFPIDTSSENSV